MLGLRRILGVNFFLRTIFVRFIYLCSKMVLLGLGLSENTHLVQSLKRANTRFKPKLLLLHSRVI